MIIIDYTRLDLPTDYPTYTHLKHLIRKATQIFLDAALVYTDTLHLTFSPMKFQAQVPTWVPFSPDFVVFASGVVEIALTQLDHPSNPC